MDAAAILDVDRALRVATRAVQEAGGILLELRRRPVEVLCEEAHDIKLKADQLAEARILDVLRGELPLPVLTEESGEHGDVQGEGPMWVVVNAH